MNFRGPPQPEVVNSWPRAFPALGVTCSIQGSRERDRPGTSEIYELIADNRRAREVLGWEPTVPLQEGLRLTVAGIER